jgi:hypothetical protein
MDKESNCHGRRERFVNDPPPLTSRYPDGKPYTRRPEMELEIRRVLESDPETWETRACRLLAECRLTTTELKMAMMSTTGKIGWRSSFGFLQSSSQLCRRVSV